MSRIRRRQVLIGTSAIIGSALIPLARAQKRLPVLGIFSPGNPGPNIVLLEKRLSELGWIEGKTLLIERVYAENKFDRLPELAAMLVKKKVDVIWTSSPLGAVAAARATTSIPIVFWRVGFPVEYGLIDSLARPGRNVTGLAFFADESIYTKRIQLLREIVPNARRLAALTSSVGTTPTVSGGNVDFKARREKTDAAARNLGFEFRRFEIAKPADFEPLLDAIVQWKADSLYVLDLPQTVAQRKAIIEFAQRQRLPAIYETLEWAQAGGLISHGIVFEPTLLRTAEMIDRIFRGAKPADMPVELPSKYELVVNLGTAKSLGLTIPQLVLVRADEVIR